METVTQFSWDSVGARADASWLWNAETDDPGIGRAPAMFRAAQKLWDDPHLTVCGWYSGSLTGGAVSANRSDSLSSEDEERRERKRSKAGGVGKGRQWVSAIATTELTWKGLSLNTSQTSSSSSVKRKGF